MESVTEHIRQKTLDGGSSLAGQEDQIVQGLDRDQKNEAARAGVAAIAAAQTAELEQK